MYPFTDEQLVVRELCFFMVLPDARLQRELVSHPVHTGTADFTDCFLLFVSLLGGLFTTEYHANSDVFLSF